MEETKYCIITTPCFADWNKTTFPKCCCYCKAYNICNMKCENNPEQCKCSTDEKRVVSGWEATR